MDEAAMAKALEGKFFWERTTKYEPANPETMSLRRAQREFAPIEEWYQEEVEEEPEPRLWQRKPPPPVDFVARVNAMKEVIAAHFRLEVEDIHSRSKRKGTITPKKFFYWCLCRYFKKTSLVQMAKVIDRDHSTIIYGRDGFELEKHLHAELVAKMDEFMDYQPG